MPLRYRIRLTASSVVLWALMRGILLAGGVLVPEPVVSLGIVSITLWLIRIDMRTMGEDVFLANLGVGRRTIWLVALSPALILEILAGVMGRALGLQ